MVHSNLNIDIYIYARMSSSRLPQKVLKEINGESLLGIVVSKLNNLPFKFRVLTSSEESDDPLINWCEKYEIDYFRGSLNNVAKRTMNALREHPCDAFFRVNADSPFLQISLLEKAADIYQKNQGKYDLISNIVHRTYPYGIAVELINAATFKEAYRFFKGVDYEHITSFFYTHKNQYNIYSIERAEDLSNYRLVVDTQDDWDALVSDANASNEIFYYPIEKLIQTNYS